MIIFTVAAAGLLSSCLSIGDGSRLSPVSPLHEAVRDGDLPQVKKLLDQKANVNATDAARRTPLHYAAANGEVSIARLLISYGADVDSQDRQGNTPLHYAATNCYYAIGALLIKAGASPGIRNDEGKTARVIAQEEKCRDLFVLLTKNR